MFLDGYYFVLISLFVHRKYLEKAEVYDLEFVFDYRADYARLKDIINVVVENVKFFKEKNQYPLNLSLEMRFMTYRYLSAFLMKLIIKLTQHNKRGYDL